MGLSTYKMLRLITFMLTGIIGTAVAAVLMLLQFPMMGIFLYSIIASVVCGAIGFVVTGLNPWIQAVQGDAILVVDLNSTGVGKFYICKVVNNPIGGIDLQLDFGGGQKETRAYDRKVTHRMLSPQKMFMFPWKRNVVQPVVEKPVEPKQDATNEKIDKLLDFLIKKESGGKV